MKEITIEDPSKLTVHPAAALFPRMTDAELEALAEDIKANDLRMPIVLMGLEILDGRHRLDGCQRAGVTPRFVEWDGIGSPTSWIFSVNLHRRHLTPSQRAMVAARAVEVFEKEAQERKQHGTTSEDTGRAREKAAELLSVGEGSVGRAQQLISKGVPELIAAVDAGELRVAAASEIVTLTPDEQRAVVRERKVVERAREEREKRRTPHPPARAETRPAPSPVPPGTIRSSPDNDDEEAQDDEQDDGESTLDPRNRPEPQPINVTAFKGDYRRGNKPKDEAGKVDQILAAARSALYTWRWIAIEWSEDKRWDMKFALHESGQIAHQLQQAVAKLEEISAVCNGKKPAPPPERP